MGMPAKVCSPFSGNGVVSKNSINHFGKRRVAHRDVKLADAGD